MGYRLCVEDGANEFYGTKLYGYTDHVDFLSYKYLVKIGKADGDEIYDYGIGNEIVLTADEFKKFIAFYNFDLFFAYLGYEPANVFENPDIKKLVESKSDKTVYWS